MTHIEFSGVFFSDSEKNSKHTVNIPCTFRDTEIDIMTNLFDKYPDKYFHLM